MKLLFFLSVFFAQTAVFAGCDNSVVDSLTKKALLEMAKRYSSSQVGLGVSIQNGSLVTTIVAVFQGKGGNDGVKVDRIGSITIDLEKCAVKNTLIGTYEILDLNQDL
jgi:hypothetical protein